MNESDFNMIGIEDTIYRYRRYYLRESNGTAMSRKPADGLD